MDLELETHLVQYGGWEMYKLYMLALEDTEFCGVVRAKQRKDGRVVGSVVLSRGGTKLGRWIPALGGEEGMVKGKGGVGGVLGPVVKEGEDEGVLVGLLLLGVRQNKANKAGSSFLNMVRKQTHYLIYPGLLMLGK